MIQAREIMDTSGPIFVLCDNPEHPNKRFGTVGLAESYLLGNAVIGDCLSSHRVLDASDACRQIERELSMGRLGELLASLMDDPEDFDDCGISLTDQEGADWVDPDLCAGCHDRPRRVGARHYADLCQYCGYEASARDER